MRHGKFSATEIFRSSGIYGRRNWNCIGAYIAGFVAMLPFSNTGLYTGYVTILLEGSDLSLVGVVVSAVVYWWLCRSQNIQAELLQTYHLDQNQESGRQTNLYLCQTTHRLQRAVSLTLSLCHVFSATALVPLFKLLSC